MLLQYRREGLDRATRFHEPEEHIALEFEFMAYLCQQAALAFENQGGAAANCHFEKQKNFVERHLLRWVPEFCQDVTRLGRMEFYKAAAKITADFLLMEGEVTAGNVTHSDEART